jgi:hypothetical protein
MKLTRETIKRAAARARTDGTKLARDAAVVVDAALVTAGQAAKRRQRKRAVKAALMTAGKVALVAGAAAATVAVVRATGKGRASP